MNRGNVFGINGKIETECLTVVGAQYAPIGAMNMEEVDRNTELLLSFMDRASGGFPGFDLFVAPEACIQGFPQFGWENALLTMDSPQIRKFQEKCAELEVYGVFDFLLRVDEQNNYTNTAIVINDKGEIIHRYDKMNPWIPFEGSIPGHSCTVCDGANVIIRPTHYMDPWQNAWEITNKSGAYFNQVYVVAVNCSGTAENENFSCFGRSMILGPDGNVICEGANGVPSMIKADLYPGIIDAMRSQAVHSAPMYSYAHRGASSHPYAGRGLDISDYTAYKRGDNDGTV